MDGNYPTIDDAMEAVQALKKKFTESGPQFDGA
jgi:hypothetical protein